VELILTLPWNQEEDEDPAAEPESIFSKTVKHNYARVPAAGEEILIEDGATGLYRRVETVRWDNDATVQLDLEAMAGEERRLQQGNLTARLRLPPRLRRWDAGTRGR